MNLCKQLIKTAKLQAVINNRKDASNKIKLLVNMISVLTSYRFALNHGNKYEQVAKMIEMMPVLYSEDDFFYYGIDEHLLLTHENTVIGNIPFDFSLVAHKSFNDIKNEIAKTCNNTEFVKDLYMILDSTNRYVNKVAAKLKAENKPQAIRIADVLERMENETAESLFESCQRILIWNSLLHQSGHQLVGLGRIDIILERYCKDLDNKVLEEFYKTLHKYYSYKSQILKGDTGQLIIIGGYDKGGKYVCNEITISTLNIFKEINLPDPKLMLRVSKDMPDELLKSAVDCIGRGNGSPILANDDIVISSLSEFGYKKEDVYSYGVSACWEPLIIGKSIDQNNLVNVNIPICLNRILADNNFETVKDLKESFFSELNKEIKNAIRCTDEISYEKDPLLTLLSFQCWENETDLGSGGAIYNNYGLLLVGFGNTVNSLLNIKEYVFDRGLISYKELKNILEKNYANHDDLRLELLNNAKYGRDTQEAIELTNEIFDFIKDKLLGVKTKYGGNYKVGLSSPAYVDEGIKTGATFDGRFAHLPFNTHISCDNAPLTEVVSFASQLDYFNGGFNGNVIDAILPPSLFDESVVNKVFACIKKSIQMGIFEMQMNVLSYAQLVDAKAHPEKYPNLIVRVWGFSAYFNDLPEEYKDHLIRRAKEMEHVA